MNSRTVLERRFRSRVKINPDFQRRTVSYQGNKQEPGLRWMKYKEAFSSSLVKQFINDKSPRDLLDPFSGLGTAPLVAAGNGIPSTGIEIMPVGITAATAISQVANGISRDSLRSTGSELLSRIASQQNAASSFCFPHVKITEKAFTNKTERELARAREFISQVDDPTIGHVLNFACMSVLEEVSFTRKDGQFLRWDHRCGRQMKSRVNLGEISDLTVALSNKLTQIDEDLQRVKDCYGSEKPNFLSGSCLELLRTVPNDSVDLIVTSPPYANRYDYTRTYALELAWLGLDGTAFAKLRQQLLSATVENKPKLEWLRDMYGERFRVHETMFTEQQALAEVLGNLNKRKDELSNPHIVRLIEGYFVEMAVVVSEMGRILRPGGTVFMVNDNVQYHGEELPVDCILSDFAEQSGLECKTIWKLARGKGNSSQQMGKFGRREIRKCIYEWIKPRAQKNVP